MAIDEVQKPGVTGISAWPGERMSGERTFVDKTGEGMSASRWEYRVFPSLIAKRLLEQSKQINDSLRQPAVVTWSRKSEKPRQRRANVIANDRIKSFWQFNWDPGSSHMCGLPALKRDKISQALALTREQKSLASHLEPPRTDAKTARRRVKLNQWLSFVHGQDAQGSR